MKIYISHYRIPDVYVNLFYEHSGPPDKDILCRYMKGHGWKEYPFPNSLGWVSKPYTKGGMTIARTEINGETYIGSAFCSMGDVFCYKTGRNIALYRLKKELFRKLDMVLYQKTILDNSEVFLNIQLEPEWAK
jgi:hypothetical protein